jgi:hypothetical protein
MTINCQQESGSNNNRVQLEYAVNLCMKNGYLNYAEISKQLNFNGYRTRNGCQFSPGIVRRLAINS